MNGGELILALMALPLLAVPILASLHRAPDAREATTIMTAVGTFILALLIVGRTAAGAPPELNLGQVAPGISFSFRAEPIGALFACIASGLWILNSLYSIGYMRGANEKNQTRFYICFAIAISGAMGVAMADNLFSLFVFYEVLTLSTFPLVAHKGDAKATRGARIYLLTLMSTSIGFLLVAIVWTYAATGELGFVQGGILEGRVGPGVAGAMLVLYMFGIGKAALMPFHFWLPNAMVAPTPVSALLHAVAVVKAGVFCVLKVAVYVFGADFLAEATTTDFLLGVACFTMVVSSLIALAQDNLKARLAYSTVGQLAYVTTGALLATAAGFMGGALQILMHAFGKITLFMCAGAIYVATGKTEISQLDGLGRKMPLIFVAFFVGSLSIIGVPPLGGAWPKWELLQGAFQADKAWVVWALLISSVLNVAYLTPIAIRALMPPKDIGEPEPFKRPGGAPPLAVAPPVITAAGCVVLFFLIDPIARFLAPALGGM